MERRSTYEFGPFRLEADGALVRDGGRVPLAPKETTLLRLLLRSGGRVVERAAIVASVWPGVHVSEDSLTRCVYGLRRALGDCGGRPRYVANVARRGYRLLVTPRAAEAGSPAGLRVGVHPFVASAPGLDEPRAGERFAALVTRVLAAASIDRLELLSADRVSRRGLPCPMVTALTFDLDVVLAGWIGSDGEAMRAVVEAVDPSGVQLWSEAVADWVSEAPRAALALARRVAARLAARGTPR